MLSKNFLALIVLLPVAMLPTVVQAGGTIACLNGRINGGVGDIPTHNPEFYDGSDTYIGGPFATDCGEMLGRPADKTSKWTNGHGKSIQASFWITNDQCLNVQIGGDHHWCCVDKINQGSSDVTKCDWS